MISIEGLSIFPFIGFIFLIFRAWLAEVKLRDVLKDERQYMSRIYTYYLAAMMIYNFQNMTFNLLIIAVLPYMIVSLVFWDTSFFKELPKRPEYPQWGKWLALERITTHVPLVIVGLIPYFTNLKWYVLGGMEASDPGVVYGLIFAIILLYLPIITLDVRYTKKTKWKTAKMIVLGGTIISAIWVCLILFYF